MFDDQYTQLLPGEQEAKQNRTGSASRLTNSAQARQHGPKTTQPRLQVLNDLLRQLIRLRQIVQIREALVLEPEDIQAGLVARGQFLVCVLTPAALRTLLRVPRRFPFVPVLCVVAIDELNQVLKT